MKNISLEQQKHKQMERYYKGWIKATTTVSAKHLNIGFAKLPYRKLNGIEKIAVQEHLKNQRNGKYYKWLKQAARLSTLEAELNPLNHPFMRLMMAMDYNKLYELVFFELHHYLSRACFLKLALRFNTHPNPDFIQNELKCISHKLAEIFADNQGLENEAEFYDIFGYAYRAAMLDLHLYCNADLNLIDEPLFNLKELLKHRFNQSKSITKKENKND